jgi:hypothetical protein
MINLNKIKLMLISTLLFANTFAQVIPTNGLVAYYPFNGNANDITVFANHGIVNGATLTTGRNGKANSAYSFNGSSNYIVSNSTFNKILGSKSRTVSVWLKTNSLTRQSAVVFGTQVGCYGKFNIEVSQSNNASACLITGCDIFEYPSNVLNNNWNNIICVLDSVSATTGIAKVYVNGILVGTTGAITVSTLSGNIYFGQDGNSDKLNGSIDDVCIWNRALTSAEISSVVNATRQTKIYVDKNSTVSSTNGLINSPFKNIQAALDYAIDGDTVLVAQGTYYENLYVKDKKIYISGNTAFNTIIDGGANGLPVVRLEGNGNLKSNRCTVKNFTLQNGKILTGEYGSIIDIKGCNTPTIENCVVKNGIDGTASIYLYYCDSAKIINVDVFNNNTKVRAFSSTVWISRTKIHHNSDVFNISGFQIWRGTAEFNNSLIYKNTSGIEFNDNRRSSALEAVEGAKISVLNSTVAFNKGPNGKSRGVHVQSNAKSFIRNSIIWGQDSSSLSLYNTQDSINVDYSIIQNGINGIKKFGSGVVNYGIHNKSINPRFLDTINYYISDQSVAIGAASPTYSNSEDLMMNSRPNPAGSNPDIGAYESNLAQPVRLDTITILSSFDSLTVPRTNIISIKTNNLTGYGIGSYQLKLNYNASKYRLDSISKIGTTSSNGVFTVNTNTAGLVNISWGSVTDISNNLPLFKAYFTAIDSGKALFNVTNAYFNTNSVATILPKSVFNKFTYGDIDVNAAIQAYDAMLALRYSVGMDPLPIIDPLPWEPWRIKVANVDTSALVTANDASLILKYVVGMITQFPKRGIVSIPGYVTVNIENNEILVRSFEDLGGLNISFENNISDISEPSFIYNQNAISAVNKQINNYRIGMAFSEAPENGTVVLRIPLTFNHNQSLNMEIVENASKRIYQLNAVTGVNNIKNASIKIYPNPTNDFIYFEGLKEDNIVNIYDVQGKIVVTKLINEKGSIDLSGLNKGVYVVKIANSVQRIVKM